MVRILCFAVIFSMCFPGALFAEGKFFQSDFTYTLSDNDTRNDARRFCFLNARHDLLKKVKTFLLEKYEPSQYQITGEEVDAYVVVLLQIDTAEEKWDFSDEKISVYMAIRTAVDTDYIGKRIQSIRQDEDLREKIKKEQQKLRATGEEYVDLHKKLTESDIDTALLLRKDKQVISMEMDRLENIEYIISTKTRLIQDKILEGMTIDEVIEIAGQPRATATCKRPDFLNYGGFWVWVNNGVVIGKISIDRWSGPCYRYGANDTGGELGEGPGDAGEGAEPENPKFTIVLKDGTTIPTSIYYQISDVVYYKRYGGIIGIEEDKIAEIKKVE